MLNDSKDMIEKNDFPYSSWRNKKKFMSLYTYKGFVWAGQIYLNVIYLYTLFYFPAIPKPWELPPLPPPCMYSNRWKTSNVILNYYHLKSAFSSNLDLDFHKYSISNFRLKYNGKIIPSEWLIFITVKSR